MLELVISKPFALISTYLSHKPVLRNFTFCVNEAQVVSYRRDQGFPNMIPVCRTTQKTGSTTLFDILYTFLGKCSISKTTTPNPSLANAEAEYDPAGPPPITRICVFYSQKKVISNVNQAQLSYIGYEMRGHIHGEVAW